MGGHLPGRRPIRRGSIRVEVKRREVERREVVLAVQGQRSSAANALGYASRAVQLLAVSDAVGEHLE